MPDNEVDLLFLDVQMPELNGLEFSKMLPASRFIRVHRSYIVQKSKIRVIDHGRIVFEKTYIPVSDSYKTNFQKFLDGQS